MVTVNFEPCLLNERDLSCRKCANFYRLATHYSDAHQRNGFCSLGKMGTDFSLYFSWNKASTCKGFVFSEYNNQTWLLEKEIQEEMSDLNDYLRNPRSKVYKAVEAFYEELEKINNEKIAKISDSEAWMLFREEMEDRSLFFKWYYFSHIDKFSELGKRLAVDPSDYSRLLKSVQLTMQVNIQKVELMNRPAHVKLDITRL